MLPLLARVGTHLQAIRLPMRLPSMMPWLLTAALLSACATPAGGPTAGLRNGPTIVSAAGPAVPAVTASAAASGPAVGTAQGTALRTAPGTAPGTAFRTAPGRAPGGAANTAEAPRADTTTLTPFDSDEGQLRLARSTAKVDLPSLANQFEAQSNAAFCGPTSAAIVLNALNARRPELPRDRSRLRPDDMRYLPASADISVPRFTQDNVISPGAKTRAQVLGEPLVLNGQQRRDGGYQVRQLDEMLRANQLATRLVIVDDARSEDAVRQDLIANLQRRGDYVLVNYRREAVGQQGGGHISPLGAYDAASDSFLVLDVNPATAGWVWMPTAVLLSGMRSFDTIENRGYVHVERR